MSSTAFASSETRPTVQKLARCARWVGGWLAALLLVAGCGGGGGGGDGSGAGSGTPAAATSTPLNPVADFALAQESVGSGDAAPTPQASASMVSNGGFENGMNGWIDWGGTAVVAGQANSGTSALRVGTSAGGAGQSVAGIVPGNTYRLRAQAKVSTASETAYVGVNFIDEAGIPFTQNSVLVSSTAYTATTLEVVAPANAVGALVYVWKNAGSGLAYVDDFALELVGHATPGLAWMPNLVGNGGFEHGLAGWADWGNARTPTLTTEVAVGDGAVQVGTGAGGVGQDVGGIVAGNTYRVSALAKMSSPGEIGYFGVMFMDDAGTGLLAQNVVFRSTTYSTVEADVTAPAGATKVQVFVWKNGGDGFAFADEVSLKKVVPASTSFTPVSAN
jgi:hypothetical protein